MGIKVVDEHGYQVKRGDAPWIDIAVILERCGWTMVSRLISAARGHEMTIPRNPSELEKVLGATLSAELTEKFGGRRCLVPADGSPLLEARDHAIRQDKKAGMKHVDLRSKYRVAEQELNVALRTVEG